LLLPEKKKLFPFYLHTPLEMRVSHQRSITYFTLKQVMHIGLQNVFQENIEVGKVLENGVFVRVVKLWQFTEWTNTVVYRSVCYLQRTIEIESRGWKDI
jgi:hypothetical protein